MFLLAVLNIQHSASSYILKREIKEEKTVHFMLTSGFDVYRSGKGDLDTRAAVKKQNDCGRVQGCHSVPSDQFYT